MSTRGKLASVTPINDSPALKPVPPKRKYTRLCREKSDQLNADLLELLDNDGCTKADYKRVAYRYGVAVRTVEHRLAKLRDGRPSTGWSKRRTPNVLPDNVLISVAAERQVASVYRAVKASGEYQGSRATFFRQVNATFGARTLRGITKGVGEMRRGTFEQLDQSLFMQGFSLDLFYLRCPLREDPSARPVGAIVRETSTGVLLTSWVWPDDKVTASDIATLLAEAFRGRIFVHGGEYVFVGGVPDFLRVDNGSQFTAAELGDLLNPLAVRVINSNDYRSHENGAHEAIHRIMRAELLDHLPGSEEGIRDHHGSLLPDERPLVTLTQVRELLDRWCWTYNVRDHNGDGSRMDCWLEQVDLWGGQLPLRLSSATLAPYAKERKRTSKLYKPGVLVDGYYYTCPELENYPHKRYVIREWLRDDRTVEVFTPGGTYVGVATRNGELTAAESGALHASAGEAETHVKEIVTEARMQRPLPELPDVPIADPSYIQEGEASSIAEDDASPADQLADLLRRPTRQDPESPDGEPSGGGP